MTHNTEITQKVPCLILHGTKDTTTYWEDAQVSYKYLSQKIYVGEYSKNLSFEIEIGHTHDPVSKKSLTLIKSFVEERFKSNF